MVPKWLPNAITVLRIVLLGVFWLLMGGGAVSGGTVPDGPRGFYALASLFGIGISDVLDGFIARRYGLASKAGVILDAGADKTAQLGITGYFVFFDPRLPFWFLALLILRDLATGLGVWVLVRFVPGAHLEHRVHGKAASALMFGLFLWVTLGAAATVKDVLVLTVSALVAVSTVVYVWDGARVYRRRPRTDLGGA